MNINEDILGKSKLNKNKITLRIKGTRKTIISEFC